MPDTSIKYYITRNGNLLNLTINTYEEALEYCEKESELSVGNCFQILQLLTSVRMYAETRYIPERIDHG